MNPIEMAQFLTVVSTYDGREVTEEVATIWARTLPDVPLAAALEWLPEYYRSTGGTGYERLMPFHILEGVRGLCEAHRRAAGHAAYLEAVANGADHLGAIRAGVAAEKVWALHNQVPAPRAIEAPEHASW